jgi:hypothetical protein
MADHVDPSWTGKIVLVKRGSSTGGFMLFYDKLTNIKNGGGIGAVIYNNISGGFHRKPWDQLIEHSRLGYQFGGRDRSAGFQPQLWSDRFDHPPSPGNGYSFYDGTSMAAPHVSGAAATGLEFPSRNKRVAGQGGSARLCPGSRSAWI